MPRPINVIAIAGVIACSSPNSSTPVDAPNGSNHPIDAAVDAPRSIDAPGSGSGSGSSTTFAFSCAGNTTPPTVPATVAVTGSAGALDTNLTDLASMKFITPYTGAVSLCSDEPCTSANQLGTATASSTGQFSFSVTTHAAPVPGYVEIPAAGTGSAATLETLAYVGTPYVKDTAVPPVALVPQAAINLVAQNAAGACTTGSDVGYVAYKAVDCSGNVVTDSTNVHGVLTQGTAPVGDPPVDVYQTIIAALGSANLTTFEADAAPLKGIFVVCGVPPGATTLTVTYASGSGNVDFLPVTVKSIAGVATEVAAQPGY